MCNFAPRKQVAIMRQTSTNIIPKYRYETHYNYVKNSGFVVSDYSPLLCYRFVTTALTAQIPTETLLQTKNKIRNEIPLLMNHQDIITQSKEITRFLLLKLDSRFPNKRVTFARDYKFRNGIFSRA